MTRRSLLGLLLVLFWVPACKDTTKISMTQASAHVAFLTDTATRDVEEVRTGLPEGAEILAAAWKADPSLGTDLNAAADVLRTTRRKVQDLRIAKSTFFAMTNRDGVVLRNDQEQDRMAGKSMLDAFPALAGAKNQYTETTGSMLEAAGVRAPRADGQWVAASPLRIDGATKGFYVTGWSWSAYAYRLEFAIRGKIRSELSGQHAVNEPLIYVFVLVDKAVYGTPVSPEVSRTALSSADPLAKTKANETYADRLEITGRVYGLAVRRVPAFGPSVGLAVLRSET